MDQKHLPHGKGWGARVAVALAFVGLWPSTAMAQDSTFYLDRLRIAGAPDDGIGVWRPQVSEKTRFFGQLALGFSYNPLRTDNYVDDLNKSEKIVGGGPVTSQLTTYLNAGVEILDRAALQASFPLILFQSGNPPPFSAVGVNDRVTLSTVAPMDLRLEGRFIVYHTEDRSFKLGITGAVFAPTGNEDSFAGDTKTSGSFGFAIEYDYQKKFFVVLNTGLAIRPTATLNELNVGSELTYGVAGYVPLQEDLIRVGAEIYGSFGVTDKTFNELDATPLEWLLSAKMFPLRNQSLHVGAGFGTRLTGGYAPDFRGIVLVGGAFSISDVDVQAPDFKYEIAKEKDTDGDGYPDVIDLCPENPEDGKQPKPSDGCPYLPDRDGDGIPDVVDKCPDEPEDLDGVDDRDGCPEVDADEDGIPDVVDKCPKEPGNVVPEDPEKNGCPYYIRRVEGSAEIQILKQVEFEFDKWTILPQSFPILDEVVRLLRANKEIKLVSIEGHTDNQGTPDYNQRLSDNRARSVRDYLVNKGIEPNRLETKGFGQTVPIATNDTAEGRQRNRRVAFKIITQTIEGR